MTAEEFTAALAAAAQELGLTLAGPQLEQYARLRELLLGWNQAMNLTADTDDASLLHKHFIDGLVHVVALAADGPTADLGAGAGLPGLPFKIAAPTVPVTLIESHQRRAAYMAEAARLLGLEQVTVLPQRAEEVGRDEAHRERYQRVTARRVAELSILLEYGLPLLEVGGRAVFAKGERLEEELAAASGVAEQLGGGPPTIREIQLPLLGAGYVGPRLRRFVVVEKVAPTPDKYPRPAGRPEKRPLRRAGA